MASGGGHELDHTKHNFPTTPVAGKLKGAAFTPDRVEWEGNRLTFRAGKDFFPDQEVAFTLNDPSQLARGGKLVVKTSQTWTDGSPGLQVSWRKSKEGLPDTEFVDKYALTLELANPDKGRYAGKVYLSLPDTDKSFLAGTFVAARKRALSEPPGDDELPYIKGTVTPPLAKDQEIRVGYVGVTADGKTVTDGASTKAFEDGGGAVRSTTWMPRTASLRVEKFAPQFDFTNLPPGRYLIHASVTKGPSAWKWVDVAAGAAVPAAITLDAASAGTLAVKLTGGTGNPRLVPADLGPAPLPTDFSPQLTTSLNLKPEVADGVATFSNLPPGKYRIFAGLLMADAEVTTGKTATVDLATAKK